MDSRHSKELYLEAVFLKIRAIAYLQLLTENLKGKDVPVYSQNKRNRLVLYPLLVYLYDSIY